MYRVEMIDNPALNVLLTDAGKLAYQLQRHELAAELVKMGISPDPDMSHVRMLEQLRQHREKQERAARELQRAEAAKDLLKTRAGAK